MAAETRIYIVDGKHLVRASTPSQALRHVVKNKHTVAVASQDSIVELVTGGTKVESAIEKDGE
jgi:hypothetical protein